MRINKWILACDEGGEKCDNTSLHKVRLTIDGKARLFTLCDKHLTPFTKLQTKGRAAPQKGRVYDTPADAKRK